MTVFKFIEQIIVLIDLYLVPLIFALCFLAFMWGVFTYFIAGAAQEEKRNEGKKFLLYSIIGFVIIIAIWGIVNLLVDSLGFETKNRPPIPGFGNGPSVNEPLFDGSSIKQ